MTDTEILTSASAALTAPAPAIDLSALPPEVAQTLRDLMEQNAELKTTVAQQTAEREQRERENDPLRCALRFPGEYRMGSYIVRETHEAGERYLVNGDAFALVWQTRTPAENDVPRRTKAGAVMPDYTILGRVPLVCVNGKWRARVVNGKSGDYLDVDDARTLNGHADEDGFAHTERLHAFALAHKAALAATS